MSLHFKFGLFLSLSLLVLRSLVESTCSRGCALALGSYYTWPETNLTFIAEISNGSIDEILRYNPQIPHQDSLLSGIRISIPFTCDCIGGQFLGHVFEFNVRPRDTYDRVAELYYSNLTTEEWVMRFNIYDATRIPDTDATLNVTVNCSCGDRRVSRDYGLFQTYPLRPEDTLATIASQTNLTADLIRSYNPDSNFSAGTGLVYIPAQDETGNYPPQNISAGLSRGVIAGVSVAGVAGFLLLVGCLYFVFYRKMKGQEIVSLLTENDQAIQTAHVSGGTFIKADFTGLARITVDKSVEFSYEELAKATNDFSISCKIGQGGFGAVYYAELRGEKAAIKKMEMQASKEFLAELKVLTHVHHLNLVRLIGYCVEGSLCLVYEFIEKGNLSQHLHGSERDPLPWSTRMQIALESARGLEYIHEHTVSLYIHRDIKSANILIDKNFHAKVADFGLTKLTEVGTTSTLTGLVGTFGYMPPEYAKLGDISPKIDVYAFGVVLYELISGKEAIVKENGSFDELRGLVALFDEVFSQPDPREELGKLVDPRLGDTCHLDSVYKIAQLAKACTHEEPQLRPSMRSIVVALTTLSSSTEDWDIGILYENQGLVNLMSGR